MTLYDPRYFPVCNKTMGDWRYKLKMYLLEKREYKSDWSGKPITDECHLHEAIVTRAMAPKSLWWHYLIFAEQNCLLLLPDEHIPKPPSRQWSIQYLYEMYTREVVKEWFDSLPYKARPFILE